MLSTTDKYILNRCKKDRTFAKDYAYYNQALDTALVVYQQRTKMHFSQQELADKAGGTAFYHRQNRGRQYEPVYADPGQDS